MLPFERPVGANRRFLVTMNNEPFAGFDTYEEAMTAKKMYSKNVGSANAPSKNAGLKWDIQDRGSTFKG
jgi:hypothetical protein